MIIMIRLITINIIYDTIDYCQYYYGDGPPQRRSPQELSPGKIPNNNYGSLKQLFVARK